ncbi:hypothetical protein [Aeromonas allosaccharophila]|uniref:hypothetical protein n=1 Tax=Aeromonas allosaccharophila TaxID=656 RepID=UPI003AF40C3A
MENCRVEGMRVIPCEFLAKASQGNFAGRRGGGVFEWHFAPMKGPSNEMRRMFGLRSGEYKGGVIFNYCPFCGADLKAAQPGNKEHNA